jgi:putative membrane protein
MPLRWVLAAVHLFGFAIGLGSIWVRYRTLRGSVDRLSVSRAIVADNWWALSAVLLIGTGLLRAFVGFEKGADYYLGNHLFLTKLGLLVLILALEVVPVITMVQWRRAMGGGGEPDLAPARRVASISLYQAILLLAMLVLATGMARGVGA